MRLFLSLLLSVSAIPLSMAQLSLFVPGFDQPPMSASELGTDSQGDTTWQIVGVANTASDIRPGELAGTLTLVEGKGIASYDYMNAFEHTVVVECGINSNINTDICTVIQDNDSVDAYQITVPLTFVAAEVSASATASSSSFNAMVTTSFASSAKPGSSTGGSASQTGSGSAPSGSSKSSARSLTLISSQLLAIGLPIAAVLVA